MNVTRKLLSELRRPERNVRMHTDKQLKEFRRSIEMFGQIRPIVVDEGGVILAGNGLYETLLSMGRTEADCYVVTGLTEAQKKKLMLADNRVFDLGVDDLSALDAFVLELKDDLDIPGYEEDLLRAMVMEADEAADTLCAAASLTTDWMTGEGADNIRASRRVMLALLLVSILIANIPGLTVTHLFLFYGTLRASTLLPTVMTLLGKKLSAGGVFAGVITALCVGLPIFAYGNIAGIPALKTAGSLTTVLSSGVVAVIASRKAVST